MTSTLNNSELLCSPTLRWTSTNVHNQQNAFRVCLVAVVTHFIFWFQIVIFPALRQKSLQWIYAYLLADGFLLVQFFFVYIARTYSKECSSSHVWSLFVCYVDATLDNYLNILQVYILLALNMCRFIQIAFNYNVYEKRKRLLIFAHLVVYCFPLFILILQYAINWAYLTDGIGGSCDVRFTNYGAQTVNLIMAFILPICLNIFVIFASIDRIHRISSLRIERNRVSAREKYYRSLVIQFVIFYIIWFALWSPNIIVYQLISAADYLTTSVRLLNFIEIALDPIIVGALDARFWQTWKSAWIKVKTKDFLRLRLCRRRIRPETKREPLQITAIAK